MGSESSDTVMSFHWIACLCLSSLQLSSTLGRDVLLHAMDRSNPQGPHFRKFLESPKLRLMSGGVPLTITQTQSISSLVPQDLSLVTTNIQGPTLNNLDLVSSPEGDLQVQTEGGLGSQGDLLIQGGLGLGGEVEGGGALLLPVQLHPEEKLGVNQI